MSVSYGGDSITFADGSVQSGGWSGMKHRIINGAMVISQRNGTSATTVNGNDIYTLDRFKGWASGIRCIKALGRFMLSFPYGLSMGTCEISYSHSVS